VKHNLLVLVYFLLFALACNSSEKEKFIRDVESRVVGTYYLDTTNSILGSYSNLDTDWEVMFTPDKHFYFSESLPYLIDTVGTWKYVFENDVAYLLMEFRSGGDEQVLTDSNYLILKSPQARKANLPVKEIVLRKK
jgi:hypothetical protein